MADLTVHVSVLAVTDVRPSRSHAAAVAADGEQCAVDEQLRLGQLQHAGRLGVAPPPARTAGQETPRPRRRQQRRRQPPGARSERQSGDEGGTGTAAPWSLISLWMSIDVCG